MTMNTEEGKSADATSTAIELLARLVQWANGMGGWDAPVWHEAAAFVSENRNAGAENGTMAGYKKEPEQGWQDTVNSQGWDEASQIIHLEGFLRARGLFADLAQYAKDVAAEENRESREVTLSSTEAVVISRKGFGPALDGFYWTRDITSHSPMVHKGRDFDGPFATADEAISDARKHGLVAELAAYLRPNT